MEGDGLIRIQEDQRLEPPTEDDQPRRSSLDEALGGAGGHPPAPEATEPEDLPPDLPDLGPPMAVEINSIPDKIYVTMTTFKGKPSKRLTLNGYQ